MNRLVPTMGFLLLSSAVAILLLFTLYEAWALHSVGGIVVLTVLIGALFEIARESRRMPCLEMREALNRENALNWLSLLGGALLAYSLSVDVGLGAVTASSLVGLVAAVIAPDYAVPLYCGAFVGMTSARLLISHSEVAIAGAVSGVVYVLTACAYPGLGGKLGTIAFVGSAITGWGLNRSFLITPIPNFHVVTLIVAHAVVATFITYWINVTLGHGAVLASGVVGVIGGLILPAIYPYIGETLAVMVVCASFAGMSSRHQFPNPVTMLVVGLITGIVFVYSMPLLGGAGGKLGSIAFSSVLAVRGYKELVELYRQDSRAQ